MGVTSTSRLLSPEEIAVQAGQQVAYVRLPERAYVFAERETRLRQLAAGHAMREYLLFMAELARVQHEALQHYPAVALPSAEATEAAALAGQAPLPAQGPRDPAWLGALRGQLKALLPRLGGNAAAAVVQALLDADDAHIERQADRLLGEVAFGLDLGSAPLIAAGLQTYFTHRVIATAQARGSDRVPAFGRTDDATRCPCCGSRPTASITRIGAEASGYRYLHCALCSTQWHMVRIKCTHCLGTQGIGYQSLAPLAADDNPAQAAAVQAETCDTCKHYLKIVHMERDAQVDPAADDLGSLTLDLLLADAGWQRQGVNLMLLFGDPGGGPGGDPGGGG